MAVTAPWLQRRPSPSPRPGLARVPKLPRAWRHSTPLHDAFLWTSTVVITAEHSKKGQQEYEGLRLNAVLDRASVQERANKLVVTAADGYAAEVFLAEVRDCADCLLGFTNTPGKLELVMPDLPSNAWVKDVVQIEVK